MNQTQRKYLKGRIDSLRFSRYVEDNDDTPAIKKLRKEIAEREKKRLRNSKLSYGIIEEFRQVYF